MLLVHVAAGTGIAIDPTSNAVFVAGFLDSRSTVVLYKLSGADGAQIWHFTAEGGSGTVGHEVAVDANGDAFFAGQAGGRLDHDLAPEDGHSTDGFLIKLRGTDGTVLWHRQPEGHLGLDRDAHLGADLIRDVAVRADGTVVVVGHLGANAELPGHTNAGGCASFVIFVACLALLR